MTTTSEYQLVFEEFKDDVKELYRLVLIVDDRNLSSSKMRLAVINGNVLLLYATFEEFIRQVAMIAAKQTISDASDISELPKKMAEKIFDRHATLLATLKKRSHNNHPFDQIAYPRIRSKINSVINFFDGDLTQDIYHELCKNDSNLRGPTLNSLFKISGHDNICSKLDSEPPMQASYNNSELNFGFGNVVDGLTEFVELRNDITHSLGATSTISQIEFKKFYKFTIAIGASLVTYFS